MTAPLPKGYGEKTIHQRVAELMDKKNKSEPPAPIARPIPISTLPHVDVKRANEIYTNFKKVKQTEQEVKQQKAKVAVKPKAVPVYKETEMKGPPILPTPILPTPIQAPPLDPRLRESMLPKQVFLQRVETIKVPSYLMDADRKLILLYKDLSSTHQVDINCISALNRRVSYLEDVLNLYVPAEELGRVMQEYFKEFEQEHQQEQKEDKSITSSETNEDEINERM